MRNRLISLAMAILLSSCSQVETLNLKEHKFNNTASQIVWFQVPGLTDEQLAMLRFSLLSSNQKTSFEDVTCMGKMWNYNLYGIRPKAHISYMSQMVGSKNIKNNCSDYKSKPIWSYLENQGYSAGVLEYGVSKQQSLEKAWSCKDEKAFRQNLTLWKMSKNISNKNSFHYQGNQVFAKGQVYFDKSCQGKLCYTSLQNNVKSLWERFKSSAPKSVFIVRDFSYLKALESKNIVSARERLMEIEKAYRFFSEKIGNSSDILLILTTAEGREFEFPKRGKEWAKYEASGKHIVFRNSSLMSSVYAKGASAENFCGIFEENEVLKRALWKPQNKEIKISIPAL